MDLHTVLGLINADREEHVSFLQRFIRAPSANPPGDTRAAAATILSYLKSKAVPTEIIAPNPLMPNVVSDFTCGDPQGPRLILNGHIDVFPVGDGSDWARDPWSGDRANGRIYGRGTVDMKAGTAASVIAYAYLYKYRQFLRGSVALCAVSDEETGGKFGSKFLLEDERWRGDCMINAEPGGTRNIRFAEKGTLRLSFRVRTEGAHGAYLHKSKSAVRIAARLINDLAEVERIFPKSDPRLVAYMRRKEVRDTVDDAMGEGAADIMFKCTLNIGIINGGLKVNMIPGDCQFQADLRLPVGLEAVEVLDLISETLKKYSEVTMLVQEAASNPSSVCSHEHPMVEILSRTAGTLTGDKVVAIPSLGATDCKFWRYRQVPAYVYGVSPETMAARDESVSEDEFLIVLKTHALAGWEYLGGRK